MASQTASRSHAARALRAAMLLFVGAVLLSSTRSLAAQSATLTIGSAADAFPAGPFGQGTDASIAMGQTFVRPADAACALTCYLQGFSFWLGNSQDLAQNPESLQFRAYLAVWAGDRIAATAPLFASEVFSGPSGASQRYDFAASNLMIETGLQYVAFLSTVGFALPGDPTTSDFDIVFGDPADFPAGGWVYTNRGSVLDDLSSTPWDLAGDIPELQARFEARFTTAPVSHDVPEPAAALLLASGLLALVLAAKRRA